MGKTEIDQMRKWKRGGEMITDAEDLRYKAFRGTSPSTAEFYPIWNCIARYSLLLILVLIIWMCSDIKITAWMLLPLLLYMTLYLIMLIRSCVLDDKGAKYQGLYHAQLVRENGKKYMLGEEEIKALAKDEILASAYRQRLNLSGWLDEMSTHGLRPFHGDPTPEPIVRLFFVIGSAVILGNLLSKIVSGGSLFYGLLLSVAVYLIPYLPAKIIARRLRKIYTPKARALAKKYEEKRGLYAQFISKYNQIESRMVTMPDGTKIGGDGMIRAYVPLSRDYGYFSLYENKNQRVELGEGAINFNELIPYLDFTERFLVLGSARTQTQVLTYLDASMIRFLIHRKTLDPFSKLTVSDDILQANTNYSLSDPMTIRNVAQYFNCETMKSLFAYYTEIFDWCEALKSTAAAVAQDIKEFNLKK